jgi:hypothetical protein
LEHPNTIYSKQAFLFNKIFSPVFYTADDTDLFQIRRKFMIEEEFFKKSWRLILKNWILYPRNRNPPYSSESNLHF